MSLQKATSALAFIPSDDREIWVSMAMSLKSEFGEDGFSVWDDWSRSAKSYRESSAKSVWRSVKSGGKTGIGSLFHLAQSNGWRDNGQHDIKLTKESAEQLNQRRIAREQETRREEEIKLANYQKAERKAKLIIDACIFKSGNYYLNSKGMGDISALETEDGVLVVPMRDFATNKLVGYQSITWIPETKTYSKKMCFGMKARGAVLRLGNKQATKTILCEGYATGLSIEMAVARLRLPASVVICFSAGNLGYVASMVKGSCLVFADNDVSGVGEAAAKKTGYPYVMSDVVGEDANDMHQRIGLMRLCSLLMSARKAFKAD